jgi:hypothetical protein
MTLSTRSMLPSSFWSGVAVPRSKSAMMVLLCHGGALVVLGLRARLRDGLADHRAHRLGLDDVVGAVDLGQALAFCVAGLADC